jgi:hypothetical protein
MFAVREILVLMEKSIMKDILNLIWQIILCVGGIAVIGIAVYGILHYIIGCI